MNDVDRRAPNYTADSQSAPGPLSHPMWKHNMTVIIVCIPS